VFIRLKGCNLTGAVEFVILCVKGGGEKDVKVGVFSGQVGRG